MLNCSELSLWWKSFIIHVRRVVPNHGGVAEREKRTEFELGVPATGKIYKNKCGLFILLYKRMNLPRYPLNGVKFVTYIQINFHFVHGVVVKSFLSLCFAFIFVRAILCLKLNVAAALVHGGGGRRSSAGYKFKCIFFLVAVSVPTAITPNHVPMNRLLWISVGRNNYSPGRVTSKWSSRKR